MPCASIITDCNTGFIPLVLHRYLQTRLPDYDYETHFGGVRYLFVRGMQPELAMSGVYQDRPDLERVEALAALFGGGQC